MPQGHQGRKEHKELDKEKKTYQEEAGKQIVDIAFRIHKTLGPGLLESVYEKCFCYEISKRGLSFTRQQKVSIVYDNIVFEEGLRPDLLVEELVIIELKTQENDHPVWEAQLLGYLKLTGMQLGYIINFTVSLIKDGIKRMVLS